MQTVRAVVSTAIADSARVQQVGGMFDLGVPARVETVFSAELPDRDEPWRIGCIVGPSGSGKSAIARQAYGDDLARDYAWPERKAVVDCFGNLPIKRITGMLTAVGFSSPPAWIRPYATLSNGEQFRANLARALLLGIGKNPDPVEPGFLDELQKLPEFLLALGGIADQQGGAEGDFRDRRPDSPEKLTKLCG